MEKGIYLQVRTNNSKIETTIASRCRLYFGQEMVPARVEHIEDEKNRIGEIFTLDVSPGNILDLEKLVAIYTSKDKVTNYSVFPFFC